MEVADVGAIEEPAREAQRRVADIAVQLRHRATADAAQEAVAHHQVGAGAELLEEGLQAHEIVAAVGIAHRDIRARRRPDAAE